MNFRRNKHAFMSMFILLLNIIFVFTGFDKWSSYGYVLAFGVFWYQNYDEWTYCCTQVNARGEEILEDEFQVFFTL